ncbi:hypothetical protein EDD84_35080 [Burkholderia gladioli]|nr:hypothetical protein EDD84_35080 [Burkholderia gladioli]
MEQGKKTFACRSTPPETQNRRVLPSPRGTICGAPCRAAPRLAPVGRRVVAGRCRPAAKKQANRPILAADALAEWGGHLLTLRSPA